MPSLSIQLCAQLQASDFFFPFKCFSFITVSEGESHGRGGHRVVLLAQKWGAWGAAGRCSPLGIELWV